MSNPIATFETSMGTFKAEIYSDQMPITSDNFIKLVKEGFYDDLHFHRVIQNFMIQFGCEFTRNDPNSARAGTGNSPFGRIKDEHPAEHRFSNEVGTLSMAITGQPNSGGAQFFINTKHNAFLDYFSPGQSKHPVFGRVTQGMEVVNAIESVDTDANDRPTTPVQMIRITVG